ncbi:MAG: DUF1080 domain-containing protein, partial [Bacteroidales bacterium]|nr:DUF1080 domain-containing protein [Bacteroidales bacterium]
MKHLLLIILLIATPTIASDKVLLTKELFQAWQSKIGTWFEAGNATLDPNNPRLFKAFPGKGVMINGADGRTDHLVSKQQFGDVYAHVEFMVPQGSNSGVYFMGRYEIQVFDSYQVKEPKHSDCGGIYQRWDPQRDPKGYEGHPPRVNASRPPGIWQEYDIIFIAPRFNEAGEKIKNARFQKVRHNGKLVHKDVELTGPTRASLYQDEKPLGPLMLQGDHGPVAYRNIR